MMKNVWTMGAGSSEPPPLTRGMDFRVYIKYMTNNISDWLSQMSECDAYSPCDTWSENNTGVILE